MLIKMKVPSLARSNLPHKASLENHLSTPSDINAKVETRFQFLHMRYHSEYNRYLFCSCSVEPRFGITQFDVMAYFGFGSGEFHSIYPAYADKVKVSVSEVCNVDDLTEELASTLRRKMGKNDVYGILYDDGVVYEIEADESSDSTLSSLHLNWTYYTSLGSTEHADDVLKTFRRTGKFFNEESVRDIENLISIQPHI